MDVKGVLGLVLIIISMGGLILISWVVIDYNTQVIDADRVMYVETLISVREDVNRLQRDVLSIEDEFLGLNQNLGRMEMYRHEYKANEWLNGVYHPNENYYCVWTDERSEAKINNTVSHEECHAFIDIDFNKHFCGDE